MTTKNNDSSSNAKVLLVFTSIAAILGLWMVFASKAQREVLAAQTQPQPIVSGEIYFPEMPTLVPMVQVNQEMAGVQPEQPVQELRNVSIPTPVMKQSAPQVGIQSIIIGGGSTSSGGGGSSSSQQSSQTTTKAS